ncbi:MAG: class I SAM-dependent methyltransferase [Planctomycetes bacterium]|nr:class I SAM-dependent methyltransferase [Planctomycetota bacterium]
MENSYHFLKIPYRSPIKIANEGLLKSMLHVAPKYAKGKLVDIGCGTKPYENIFRPYVDSYFGVDYKSSAESNYGDQTNADLYVDCTETGIDKESYDTLLSTQVMEHIYDTDKYVKECHRLLKKGGKGIFTIPMSWRCHAEPYDYHRFTKYSLEKIFTSNGFDVIELTEIEGAFASSIQHLVVFLTNRHGFKNIIYRAVRKVTHIALFSVLNFLGLKLDSLFRDDKFCLNYLLVVQKK